MRPVVGVVAALLMFGASSAHAEEAPLGPKSAGMPQLNPDSYPSQLFWLAVFFALFYAFMNWVAMPRVHRIIDARQTRIEDDLSHAGEASGAANQLKQELETRLARAREESRKLIGDTAANMNATAAKRESELAAELTRRIEAAESEITAAKSKAMGTVNEIAASIVAAALPKLAPVSVNAPEITKEIESSLAKGNFNAEAA